MDKKRIIMASSTLACIGAIGFFMQGGKNAPAPMATAGMIGTAPGVNGMPTPVEISDISLTSADTELVQPPTAPKATAEAPPQVDAPVAVEREVAPEVAKVAEPIEIEREGAEPVDMSLLDTVPASPQAKPAQLDEPKITEQCEIAMTGTETAGALVKLELDAPCLPNERVTLHHNGMMFTETTDARGRLGIAVPALAENAVFIASFANNDGAVANVNVTTLGLYDRAVVQSDFISSVGLHALEYGSGYEGNGHIWANAPGDIAGAAIGKGGFMTLLGNPAVSDGNMAQVYTFPSGLAEQSGDVELSVEIEVTAMNCGHEIEAQSLQVMSGAQPRVQALDMTMPDCDAVGDFLVLKNLVNDLKVAAISQ